MNCADETSREKHGPRDLIISLLRRESGRARFIVDLCAALAPHRIDSPALDQALADLEKEGKVIVRDHFCADPHLAGADLRVAALLETGAGDDPQLSAIRRIDETWNKWLTEYLANHRCG